MQEYAGIYLLQNHSTYFGFLSHPSSGVHKTLSAASGTATTFLRMVVAHILRPVPEDAITVLCTPDDG